MSTKLRTSSIIYTNANPILHTFDFEADNCMFGSNLTLVKSIVSERDFPYDQITGLFVDPHFVSHGTRLYIFHGW